MEKPNVKRLLIAMLLLPAMAVAAGCEVEDKSGGESSGDSSEGSTMKGGFEAKGDYHPHMAAGKSVKVDGVRYRILSAKTAKTLGNEFSKETADGLFLVMHVKAANDRKESSSLSDEVMAIEANGNTYKPDSEGTFAHLISQGGDQNDDPFFLRDIQPGTSTKGYVVFDLPKKVATKSKLEVRFNELGFGPTYGYLAVPAR
jgi:hypothetical protein